MTSIIQTKYGNASVDAQGYYVIHSNEKGNRGKKLHRLIFEDFYQINLSSDIVIHHEDGNRLNNEIWNLVPMTNAEHSSIHSCTHTEEFKRKMSERMQGEKHHMYGTKNSMKTMLKKSTSLNTSGYFRVIKQKKPETKQGFLWTYSYYENRKRKRITSTDLKKLEEKVKAKGLEWVVVDEDKARAVCEDYGFNYNEVC